MAKRKTNTGYAKRTKTTSRGADRRQAGEGLKDIMKGIKKVNRFLRKHKVISRGLQAYDDIGSPFGAPYTSYARRGANIARKYGYGKKKRGGRGLKRAGAGISQSGGVGQRRFTVKTSFP